MLVAMLLTTFDVEFQAYTATLTILGGLFRYKNNNTAPFSHNYLIEWRLRSSPML
jgi:hypothetical protein